MAEYLIVDPVFLIASGALFALLIFATLLTLLLKRIWPSWDLKEIFLRIRSWWVIVIAFAVAMVAGRLASLVFFAFVSTLALREYLKLIPTRQSDSGVLFWAFLAIPTQYLWIYLHSYGMFIVFIPVYAFLFLPVRMLMNGEAKGFLNAIGALHWGLMTTVFSLSHAAYLLVLPGGNQAGAKGIRLVFFLIVLTQLNDIAQFLWGRSFGKTKIIPSISPNKSWIGLVGGVGTTIVLASLLAPYLTPLSNLHALAAGAIIGIGGFLGDITISALKRDIGVGSSGNMIPGHGGILDRVDSLMFTAPLFLHFIRYFYFSG